MFGQKATNSFGQYAKPFASWKHKKDLNKKNCKNKMFDLFCTKEANELIGGQNNS